MKGKLSILVALVLVLTIAAPLASLAEEPVNITIWTLTDRQNAYLPISEAYMAKNPNVKIEISFFDTDGIKDACKVAAASVVQLGRKPWWILRQERLYLQPQ